MRRLCTYTNQGALDLNQMAITKLLVHFFSERQARTVGLLVSGVIIGQLAVLLATPLLTRLFSPNEFGVYAMLIASLNVLAPISSLRLELSIPIPKKEEIALHSLMLSCAITCLLSLLLGTIIWIYPYLAINLIGISGKFEWVIWILPVGLLTSGLQQSLGYWNIRNEQFLRLSQSRGGYGVITATSQLILGASGVGVVSLFAGEIIGRIFSCLWLANRIICSSSRKIHRIISINLLLKVVHKFRRFIFLSTPSALINSLSIHLPIIMIGHFYDAHAAGLLLLAQRVVSLPTALLVGPISQTYVAQFAKTEDPLQRASLYISTVRRFSVMTAPVFLLLGYVSPILFSLLFGPNWMQSGLLGKVLAPFFFMQLLSGSTVSSLDILQEHWIRLNREFIFLAGSIISLSIGYYFKLSLVKMIYYYSIFGVVFYVLSLFFVYRIILHSRSK